MNPKAIVFASVVLSAVAQISLKLGLTRMQRNRDVSRAGFVVWDVVRQGYIWLWAGCFAVATLLWLYGLQGLELSYAYPLISFGYVLVSVLSLLLFHEHVDRNRWTAIVVISVGVVLIAGS